MSIVPYQTPPALLPVKRFGLDCSRNGPPMFERSVDEWMEILAEAYEQVTGNRPALDKLPRERQRMLAGMAENLTEHHFHAMETHQREYLIRWQQGAPKGLRLDEAVNTTDIADFTTQQLAFVTDVFAPISFIDAVTTIVMTGPTAYIHRQEGEWEDACGDYYEIGDALVDGLDPSCAQCPTECTNALGIDLGVTAELVEADCYRLAAKYCIPAQWHYSSQYGGDLGAAQMELLRMQIMRSVQHDYLTALVAYAGSTQTWNVTPAAGSYWESANTNEWYEQLWKTINAANRASLTSATGRMSLDQVLGDVTSIGYLEDAVDIEYVDQQPENQIFGRGDVMTSYYGRTKVGRYNTHRFAEGFPEQTIILTTRENNLWCPWIPFTSLGVLVDPENAEVKMGGILLAGRAFLRAGRIQEVAIGD